jgi:hypothetical protein
VSRGQLNFLGLADSDGQVSLTGDSSRSELPWQARFSCQRDHFRSLFLPRVFSIFRDESEGLPIISCYRWKVGGSRLVLIMLFLVDGEMFG